MGNFVGGTNISRYFPGVEIFVEELLCGLCNVLLCLTITNLPKSVYQKINEKLLFQIAQIAKDEQVALSTKRSPFLNIFHHSV